MRAVHSAGIGVLVQPRRRAAPSAETKRWPSGDLSHLEGRV